MIVCTVAISRLKKTARIVNDKSHAPSDFHSKKKTKKKQIDAQKSSIPPPRGKRKDKKRIEKNLAHSLERITDFYQYINICYYYYYYY